jgi:hypothetical protein
MPRETFDNDTESQILSSVCIQLHILLLKKLLTDKISSEPLMADFKMMDDRIYLAGLRRIIGSLDLTTGYLGVIVKLKDGKQNFHLFESSQKANLIAISQGITFDGAKAFAISEMKRLRDTPKLDLDSIAKPDFITQKVIQKKKADELIEIANANGSVNLNRDNFSYLIKEYSTCSIIVMNSSKYSQSSEKKDEIYQMQNRALRDIGGLINNNKDKLEWLNKIRLEEDKELELDLAKFIHETCHLGDSKTLENVIEKLGDNFNNLMRLVPFKREEMGFKNNDSITIENMMIIIQKRINKYQQRNMQTQADKWIKIQRIFNDEIVLDGRLGGLSVSAPSEALSSSPLVQRPSSSSENVAKSGPVAGARGGASARLDRSKARGGGEAKR